MRRPNRRHAIRAERRLPHALTSACAVKHENIFVAKTRDSESAKRPCAAIAGSTMHIIASRMRNARVQKNTCRVVFFCNRISRKHRRCGHSPRSQARVMQRARIALAKRRRVVPSTLL
jgi:hypothetical protein